MQFNSVVYATFLPLVFAIYWALSRKPVRWQNLFVLSASYLFYGWWDWRFLALILASSTTDFILGQAIDRAGPRRSKRLLLLISLVVNLGILGFFKYFNFFADSFAGLLEAFGLRADTLTLKIILPIGISFYTFQTLSYTIDIYRGKIRPTKDVVSFFAFVAFFPQLVAGPIERAANLLPQFQRRRTFSYDQAVSGLRLILWGLVKKVVIADGIGQIVQLVFTQPSEFQGPAMVIAIVGFGLQAYGDFSGYSDIAIGSARLLGFELMINFRTPLFSKSPQEFWRRWHISLSTWFRDYVYFPLGGSRAGLGWWIFAVMVTFTISGLWHGAAWTFVLFGVFHGVGLVVHGLVARFVPASRRIPAWAAFLMTLTFVSLLWPFFVARNISETFMALQRALLWEGAPPLSEVLSPAFAHAGDGLYLLGSVVLFLLVEIAIGKRDVDRLFDALPRPVRWLSYYAIVAWIFFFGQFENAPQFIYFQF